MALPRGAHSASFLFSAFSYYSLLPRLTPFPALGRPTSSAVVRGRSCRFSKCKYQPQETKGKGWRCKMSPLCQYERAYTSMFFKLRERAPLDERDKCSHRERSLEGIYRKAYECNFSGAIKRRLV